jgi:hypothetical protein
MDIISLILSTLLFYAFVPGVFGTYPRGGSKATILLTHAVAFAITTSLVMGWYWNMRESMSNYGDRCPNGYVMGVSQDGTPDCVPVGGPTYHPITGLDVKSA